jgi:hypothetical protein
MSKRRRIAVIVEGGKVIGAHAVPVQPKHTAAASAVLRAGPGQLRYEVLAEMPSRFESAQDIERFHASLLPLLRG